MLLQSPSCSAEESLKRSNASDGTVTGRTTGSPLEELLLDELELLLESPELLEELEEEDVELDAALEELDELFSSSPWVTNKPLPPQAAKPVNAKDSVRIRSDLTAVPCNTLTDM